MKILITGSSGLIGGEAVEYFDSKGHTVIGLDNNMRKEFFGPSGDTLWNMNRIFHKTKNFKHMPVDIRDQDQMYDVFHRDKKEPKDYQGGFDVVIHCAAQPSHDKAKEIPLLDHSVNVLGTLMCLEMTRQHCPNAVFIFMSTNKVYGDAPNELLFSEKETRYDFDVPDLRDSWPGIDHIWQGFNEQTRTDQSTHSVFGANKLAADIMVQEYARTYGLKTVVLRGGCLTGPGHSGVELHGFLSYLVKCAVTDIPYKIYGYKGKQVRDNIHSYDVIRAMEEIIKNPRPGSVYNIGGGRYNSISVNEAIQKIEQKIHKKMNIEYIDQVRLGDHKCYITDMSKFENDYPDWHITKSLDQILDEMIQAAYWDKHSDDPETLEYPLTEDSIVMDIGGYRGTWSADIVAKYNPRIFLFEPTAEFSKECCKRFKDNPKVTIIQAAIGDSHGHLILSKQGMNTSAYRGAQGQPELITDRIFGDPEPEKVYMLDIHSEIRSEFKQVEFIDLISMNCEGGEYKILDRLIDTGDITKIKYLQVQFHNFYPNASQERDRIREKLSLTHKERFCYAWVWESWELK